MLTKFGRRGASATGHEWYLDTRVIKSNEIRGMSKTEWLLIANPLAGGGRAHRAAKRAAGALEQAGQRARVELTACRGDATRLGEQAIGQGAGRVVVCGGDGTINEVLPTLAETDIPLGLLPCGSCNDLALALGIPLAVDAAIHTLLRGRVSAVDLAGIDDGAHARRLFCTVAACGFDAEVSQLARNQPAPLSGTAGYIYATLRHLRRYRPSHVRVSGEFGTIDEDVLLVATANTRSYGGGMRIAPQADPRDGKLDVCIVRHVSSWTVLRLLTRIFSGGHVGHPAVRIERSAWVTIEAIGPLARELHADGEFLAATPCTLTARPGALNVILPTAAL